MTSAVSDAASSVLPQSALLSGLGKFLKTSVVVGTATAAAALIALYAFQKKIIYPSALNDGHGKVATPDEYGMPYESVDLKTKDGETLQSFVLLQDKENPQYTNKTVLILSPNAGNIGQFMPIVRYIYEALRYNVFIYSYRGYGHSTGQPSEQGLMIDADTAMEYIASNKQLAESSLVVYGRSIGGAVAIYIASQHSDQVSGMILENTFLSLPQVVPYLFPILTPFTFMVHEKWPSEDRMPEIPARIPALFLAGQKDEVVPPDHMRKLYELSKSTNKVWREFKDAHHNDTLAAPGYWDDFYNFLYTDVTPVGR